ncbi:MAG TPA: LysR family transcriptional regulator [Solirubrobacteraceae bacterium]|jgi:DNA-binding transcriptional LysR family regulator
MPSRLRPVDLVELRGFCLAIELGSLGRAAVALGVSQPALSKRMRELETFAGASLLQRSPRGVVATAAGERLYREARTLLGHAEAVEQLLDGLRDAQTPILLAASHTIAEYLLPAPLAAYREKLGHGYALELVAANSAVVRAMVRERRADLGLAATIETAGGPGLVERVLCEDEVLVAVSEGHPWARSGTVALAEFLATPMVMRDPGSNTRHLLDRELRVRGLKAAPPLVEVGSTAAAITAVTSGTAPALLSAHAVAAAPPLVAVRVRDLPLIREFTLVTRENAMPTPAVVELISYLLGALSGGPLGHNVRLGQQSPISA